MITLIIVVLVPTYFIIHTLVCTNGHSYIFILFFISVNFNLEKNKGKKGKKERQKYVMGQKKEYRKKNIAAIHSGQGKFYGTLLHPCSACCVQGIMIF